MTSKKYAILAGFMALFSVSGIQAQETNSGMYRGGGYDFNDSSLIPKKGQAQQRDFLNGQYDFPSKPRNQWEIGISGGALNVSGDVRSKNVFTALKPMQTLGWGLHVRKAWGYVVSTRLEFMHGTASGFNYQAAEGYWGHSANPLFTAGYFNNSNSRNAYYNYKTTVSELSLQMIAALNNLKFHRARNKFSLYALGGIGGMLYNAKVDIKNNKTAGTNYDFSNIPTGTTGHIYKDRKNINSALKSLFDAEYETAAERHNNRGWLGDNTFRPTVTAGLGVQFRLGKRMSLQLEDRWIYTNDDLVDGMRWQELPTTTNNTLSSSAMTRDFDNINYLSLSLNYNLGGKAVDPLWWMNPMDYGYNEMKRKTSPSNKCDNDADGDGISDCFDRCPNTPGGVSVDSHGCPFDTDGDGVADYKDKQLITPTECQPVDADGVGKCPDPECCTKGGGPSLGCASISSNSVAFGAGSAKLSSTAMSQLNSLASSMRSNPNCKVVVIGCGNGSKIEQQRSWDRVNSVINYMVDKQGIDRERFIFQYGTACESNSVEYRSAAQGEEGPSNMPPPHPNLRKN